MPRLPDRSPLSADRLSSSVQLVTSSVSLVSLFPARLELSVLVDSSVLASWSQNRLQFSWIRWRLTIKHCHLKILHPIPTVSFRLRCLPFLTFMIGSDLQGGRVALVSPISWVLQLCLWLRCKLCVVVTEMSTLSRLSFILTETLKSYLLCLCFNISLSIRTDWILFGSSMECALTDMSSWCL